MKMLKIELNNVGNEVKYVVTVEGKGRDVVEEVICFHKEHFNVLKTIIDKLPSSLEAKVLIGLIEDHFDIEEGSD